MDDLLNGVDTLENSDVEFEDWHPPTEAELKVIEAKRERQDKISKLMGEYLLKGYKMLGSTCPLCLTILLRTKQGVDYCVACSELDSDSTKDDPALNNVAAQRQVQESYLKQTTVTSAGGDRCLEDKPPNVVSVTSIATTSSTGQDKRATSALESGGMEKPASSGSKRPERQSFFPPAHCLEERLEDATIAVAEKLEWATGLLRQTQDVDTSMRLCNLIKCCADTINSLRSADHCDT